MSTIFSKTQNMSAKFSNTQDTSAKFSNTQDTSANLIIYYMLYNYISSSVLTFPSLFKLSASRKQEVCDDILSKNEGKAFLFLLSKVCIHCNYLLQFPHSLKKMKIKLLNNLWQQLILHSYYCIVEHSVYSLTYMYQQVINIPSLAIVVDCGSPPLHAANRGQSVSAPSTVFNQTATYSCAVGFILNGQATRRCLGNGSWSGDAPLCLGKLIMMQ